MPQSQPSSPVPPAFIVQCFMKVGNFLDRLRFGMMPPAVALIQMSMSLLSLRALYLAARFGIADLLASGPQSTEDLAKASATHAPTLGRVLRACAGIGVFSQDASGRWSNTRLASSMRSDAPDSMRDWLIMAGCEWGWKSFGEAEASLKSGETAFDHAMGKPFFEHMGGRPADAALFNGAMTNFVNLSAPAIAKGYDFSGIKTLMDVGGGHGRLLSAVLQAYPALQGVVFDQQEVVPGAQARLESLGLAFRCRTQSGNFFESVPALADAIMMRTVIHDWSEEQALQILRHCRQALPAGGRLLLIEMVVPEGNAAHPSKQLDLAMLWLTGGRERTEREYRELLAKAGFRLNRVVPLASPESVIEALPA